MKHCLLFIDIINARKQNMKKLANRVAIITGGAMGNGLGTAQVLAKQGATVILIDYHESVTEAANNLVQQGLKAESYIVDIRDANALKQIAESVVKKYHKVDILVNNAGVCHIVPFLETSEEIRDRTFDINIKGTWNVTYAFLPYMLKANYGKIVNLSSVTGTMVADAGEAAYATSKAAISGFTKALAMEVATHNITVNSVCPGYIATPMAESIAKESNQSNPQKVLDGIAAAIPMRRLGTIEELGDLVAFLASDESRYITGTQIVIDGGSTLPESFGAVGV